MSSTGTLPPGSRVGGDVDALALGTSEALLAQGHGQDRPLHVLVAPEAVTVTDLDRCGLALRAGSGRVAAGEAGA